MDDSNTTQREQRKADRSTLTGISAILSDIIRRADAEPIYATMAARIDGRAADHRGGRCPDGCLYCSPHYVGLTLEDFENSENPL